ncbi:MAG TPA: four helix bundle protein [Chryseosolibacter sp.]
MISSLDDFKTYNQAMELGEEVWDVVTRWKFFEKDTVGKQLVRAADSIASNLSEGLGRYHYRERKNFSYYSRGSLFETKTWLTKARNRSLIDRAKFESLISKADIIGKMLNGYISSIGVQEPDADYGSNPAFPNA